MTLKEVAFLPIHIGTHLVNRHEGGSGVDSDRVNILERKFRTSFQAFNHDKIFGEVARNDYESDNLTYMEEHMSMEVTDTTVKPYTVEVITDEHGSFVRFDIILGKGSLSLFDDSSSKERLDFLQELSMSLFSKGFYNKALLRDYLTIVSKVY